MEVLLENLLAYGRKEAVMDKDILERLSAIEHEQWAHWTKHMLNNLTEGNIERWKRQAETSYTDLSEGEKESDRKWAVKVMEVFVDIYNNDQTLCAEHWNEKEDSILTQIYGSSHD